MEGVTLPARIPGEFISKFDQLLVPEVVVKLLIEDGDAWWQCIDFPEGKPPEGATVKARLGIVAKWQLAIGIFRGDRFELINSWDVEDDRMEVLS